MSELFSKSPLDPRDWDEFRATAHTLLDACVDRLAHAEDHPWKPLPNGLAEAYRLDGLPHGYEDTATRLERDVMPYATGNTHPRFFGWVHGTGLATGILSEMVAATMNANCGGRNHGMNEVERAVIDWTRQVMGFPKTASGVLVAGTSQATVIALACARLKAIPDSRMSGIAGMKLAIYAGGGVHNAARKALELLGIGGGQLRLIPSINGQMDLDALKESIASDRASGVIPMAIVGTAGTVDLGTYDDLNALAEIARNEQIWLHIDGAFGAWTRLASEPWRSLSDGIEKADSLACDFHKWMYVPYDCGLALIRDEAIHRAAFAARPAYLEGQERGLAGGEPWFCDYGTDLSRGGRALKVWAAIECYGAQAFGDAISANCAAAKQMASLVREDDRMALAAPVVSNLCVFTADDTLSTHAQSELNIRIAADLQLRGEAVFSTTIVAGRTVLRAAITNHRTTARDIEQAISAVAIARDEEPLKR